MSINVVQIIVWAVMLAIGGGVGYSVGHSGLEKAIAARVAEACAESGIHPFHVRPNNSPAKGYRPGQ